MDRVQFLYLHCAGHEGIGGHRRRFADLTFFGMNLLRCVFFGCKKFSLGEKGIETDSATKIGIKVGDTI